MTFRAANASDVPFLLTLQETFYRVDRYPFVREVAERAIRQLVADPALGRLFVIEESGRAVGYMAVTFGFSLEFGGRDAFVDELYLAPEARGKGLGTEALSVAERACEEAGITALHLEVEHTNREARELYERRGFTEHSRHLMTKRLG